MSAIPFRLPAPADLADPSTDVVWTGNTFRVGGANVPVLEYSNNFAGWSDDLTFMHEDAAGSSHPVDLASRADAVEQLASRVPAGHPVVLEVGCSSGYLLADLRARLPEAVLIGADVVDEPLQALARRMPGVPLMRFDLLKSPVPDAVLDAMVMLNVLEHIEDDDGALAQAARMLKPGGHLVIEVPAGPHLFDSYDRRLQHFRRYEMAGLRRQLEAAGLEVVRATHLGFLVYPAFAWVKRANRRKLADAQAAEEQAVVDSQIRQTAASWPLRVLFAIENVLRKWVPLPCGIRCLAVARKPAAQA